MKKLLAKPAIANRTGDILWAYMQFGMAVIKSITRVIQVWLKAKLITNTIKNLPKPYCEKGGIT